MARAKTVSGRPGREARGCLSLLGLIVLSVVALQIVCVADPGVVAGRITKRGIESLRQGMTPCQIVELTGEPLKTKKITTQLVGAGPIYEGEM